MSGNLLYPNRTNLYLLILLARKQPILMVGLGSSVSLWTTTGFSAVSSLSPQDVSFKFLLRISSHGLFWRLLVPRENETLRAYVQRFNSDILEVRTTHPEVLIKTLTQGLQVGPLFELMAKKPVSDFHDLLAQAKRYMTLEHDQLVKKSNHHNRRKRILFDPENDKVIQEKIRKKWRMCVDFKDVNKACSKDFYSLSRIDQLVDSTSRDELLSLMDPLQDYHQIMLNRDDQKRVSFIMSGRMYRYIVMSFGLKGVGSTNRRLVNYIFREEPAT
ncbi:UNVERIFIED_CONTAM: Retrovirus-related Pol polyprotein from transposon [Sesamum calycinum]|uniref:Retrovirus-related Pol polyprotein from transposon n=1 Tax=Sesamum calycinum TaxID=2727403 RepID=A0AAW2LVZ2_9LAMI